jgi:hypothetical protein
MPERSNRDVLRILQPIPEHVAQSNEGSFWKEKLLLRLCNHQSRQIEQPHRASRDIEEDLEPFRAWARFFAGRPGKGLVHTHNTGPEFDPKRREIWWNYYKLLSQLLHDGYVYPSPNELGEEAASHSASSPKLIQSSELRRVESTHETLLLRDISFPEASEINTEIDDWVDQVMMNWSITCGSGWQDEDLGEGGQEAASRNVLDVCRASFTSNTADT